MNQETKALSIQESAALLTALLPPGEAVALAVSGGPDSMALAVCAKRAGWNCRALIVDHALRPESSVEAQSVRQELARLGIPAEILVWDHEAITSRIHVKARAARYALLAEACARHGCRFLLLAHHADDQAETILMRFAKGSGVEGLSGMKPISFISPSLEGENLRLVRPFLSVPKARLIATCEAEGVAFVRDPSNEKEKYARGRLRAVSAALAEEGLTTERLLDLGQRAGEAAEAIEFYARKCLKQAAELTPFGAIILDFNVLRQEPQAVALKALGLCFLTLHPAPYAPERQALLALYQAFQASDEGRTLSGVQVYKTGDRLTFVREVSAVTTSRPIRPGQTLLWDGRWQVTLEAAAQPGEIRALGVQPHATLDALAPDLRRAVPQGRVRSVLPALWRADDLAAIPSFCEENQGEVEARPLSPRWT